MASSSPHHQLRIFFFPFLAHGHILPMANLARLFAERGINSTIITTPANAALICPAILNCSCSIHLLLLPFPSTAETNLPTGCENTASLPHPHSSHISNLFKAIDLLQKPFAHLLHQHQPDFLISDWVYPWTTDLAQSLGIQRLVFQTCGGFSNAICQLVNNHKPHIGINDDSTPFQVPASSIIPHKIEMTKADLPVIFYHPFALDKLQDAEMKSYGMVLNSFYELEPWYVEFLRGTRKLWCVGPVGLGGSNNHHQAIDEKLMRWIDSKDPATVIYVCFGSECNFTAEQTKEMAWGLEATGHPFVWVLRSEDTVLPDGFEERIEGKGLIVRGWAPQVKILNHPAVGGFMTHCGWNSILEAVSAGLPMAAWPLHSEQFINEKLVVEVLGIGVKLLKEAAGSTVVDRETVKESVEWLMSGDEESLERRKRAKEYQAKARRAMEEGGSSYEDLSHLIEAMEENAKKRRMDRGEGKMNQ